MVRSVLSRATALATAALLAGCSTAFPGPKPPSALPRPQTLSSVQVFDPPADYRDPQVLYARTAQLPNNDLLLTWENYSPEPPPVYFPVYRSADAGKTWAELSRVTDQGLGYGLRYQPALYVLPERIGAFPKGTLLLAGSSIPSDLSSTHLDLYASADSGKTWQFVSHVAAGGEAIPNNGLTPVWEPFLLAHKGKLIYYYSDQRDNATHGQKLVHQTSADLETWGPVVDDVAYPTYTDRPGMPTVARLPDGNYIYVYEYGGGPNPAKTDGYSFPVFYRLSRDPEAFASAPHHPIRIPSKAAGGVPFVPDGSPYVVWTPAGGPFGTIVVSSGCCSQVFVNKKLGAEDAWEIVETPEAASYTRSLLVMQQDPRYVLISGGGKLPPSSTNVVSVSVIKI
ncbi:exo-1,5-alpha-L-arabinofuranobiosidase [Microdochium trichocladiopsis]|uniref:Exo-1,5-alpha-L-arabinofuranobiosidase n=1 Tax=Microdochium trichocladiopsis TaxID=1682393 RepID=A0A9P9BVX3_9PEZI|nr:exo-1,5-alpha-L-arabinofuranobiosidase [Microdochium trichocladiopsis]KAH7040197.1 exo-1,5-alpha-L-arabinofuranobiosidase [Microdochium trichocladiopsis]